MYKAMTRTVEWNCVSREGLLTGSHFDRPGLCWNKPRQNPFENHLRAALNNGR